MKFAFHFVAHIDRTPPTPFDSIARSTRLKTNLPTNRCQLIFHLLSGQPKAYHPHSLSLAPTGAQLAASVWKNSVCDPVGMKSLPHPTLIMSDDFLSLSGIALCSLQLRRSGRIIRATWLGLGVCLAYGTGCVCVTSFVHFSAKSNRRKYTYDECATP